MCLLHILLVFGCLRVLRGEVRAPIYNKKNPFPWMSEVIDMPKEKNFFETKVTEYKTGGSLEW